MTDTPFVIDNPQRARRFSQWVDRCEELIEKVTNVQTTPPIVTGTIGTDAITLALMLDEQNEPYTSVDLAGHLATGPNPRPAIGAAIQSFIDRARAARVAWLAITAT